MCCMNANEKIITRVQNEVVHGRQLEVTVQSSIIRGKKVKLKLYRNNTCGKHNSSCPGFEQL